MSLKIFKNLKIKEEIWAEIVVVKLSAGLAFLQSEGGERKDKRTFESDFNITQNAR